MKRLAWSLAAILSTSILALAGGARQSADLEAMVETERAFARTCVWKCDSAGAWKIVADVASPLPPEEKP